MNPCPKCGYNENPPNALMCGMCGVAFATLEPDPSSTSSTAAKQFVPGSSATTAPSLQMVRRDFSEEIRGNVIRSNILMVGVLVLLMLMGWALGVYFIGADYSIFGVILAAIIATVYMIVSYHYGSEMILRASHARRATSDHDQQLINVVDEMRIAAGVPMPKVYVIETPMANAFATGKDPDNATVAVTRGLMERLNREELQGVIAHEMSHVRNFDIRYAMLVAAMIGAIVLLADAFRRSWWWGGGRRRSSGGDARIQGLIMLIAILVAILAPLFAMMLQMAISRKREYLADASAVELTRNPLALASALEKLELEAGQIDLKDDAANRATQHLFIVNPLKRFGASASALFSTHPPTDDRIKRLRAMG